MIRKIMDKFNNKFFSKTKIVNTRICYVTYYIYNSIRCVYKIILPLFAFVFLFGVTDVFSLDIKSFYDLSGKKIGIQTGTSYEDYLLKKVPDASVEYFTDPNTMLISLSRNKLDAYVTDEAASIFERKQYSDLVFLEEPLVVLPVVVGIGDNSKKDILLKQVNEFITESKLNGTIDALRKYWIDNCDENNNFADRSGITGENGNLVIGLEGNYVPFSYVNKAKLEGYDVDFIYRFCRKYGYKPTLEPMEYDALSPALASGKCDIAMCIVYNKERDEEAILSDSYYSSKIIVGFIRNSNIVNLTFDHIIESFNKTFIRDSRWKQFAYGAFVSLLISSMSIICGTILGLIIYLICRRGDKFCNKIMDIISWLVGGTPVVLLLMIFYFIIFGNVDIEKIVVAIITFTIIFTISMFDMLKSGEAAVGIGQLEAALSQGFTEISAYFLIVLPQSAIHFLPRYCGEVVSLIKETSIVGYIAILDLTKISDMIRGRTFEPFFPLISTAIIYFFISWLLTVGVKKLHKSLSPETRNLKKAFRNI